jgi:hypothetical protein
MFSIFWNITLLLAFDIRTVSAKTVNIFCHLQQHFFNIFEPNKGTKGPENYSLD